jgi:hypothetical protein
MGGLENVFKPSAHNDPRKLSYKTYRHSYRHTPDLVPSNPSNKVEVARFYDERYLIDSHGARAANTPSDDALYPDIARLVQRCHNHSYRLRRRECAPPMTTFGRCLEATFSR